MPYTEQNRDANSFVDTLELTLYLGFLCVGVSRAHTHVHIVYIGVASQRDPDPLVHKMNV